MRNNYKKEEINLLYLQIVTTIVLIGTLIASVYFAFKEIDRIKTGKKKGEEASERRYSLIDKEIVLVAALIFLYISIENKKIAKARGENTKAFEYQIIAASIALIPAILLLYSSMFVEGNEISEIENPLL